MFDSARQSLLWLHRFIGIGFSGLLLIAFFMGSLALYDRELDRWMLPQLRLAPLATPLSLDRHLLPQIERLSEGKPLLQWYVELPDARRPLLRFQAWTVDRQGYSRFLAPADGRVLADVGSRGGDFFYRLHYTLNVHSWNAGARLIGLAAMLGVIALIAGVCIHARLFQELFTVRVHKSPRRLLDLHNLTGVFALPFHVLILLSGLLILFPLYLPSAISAVYPGQADQFAREASAAYHREAAGTAGRLVSLDQVLAQAREQWRGAEPAFLRVWHPGDANAYIEVRRTLADRLSQDGQTLYFDGASARLLHASQLPAAAATLQALAGLHVAHFQQPWLRGLYFLAGLSGCVMLASGLLYWLEKRRLQHAARHWGVALMTVISAALITGMPLATVAMLVANQCLPAELSARAEWEITLFYLAWVGATLHAAWAVARSSRAPWAAQCRAISALALLAVIANACNTSVIQAFSAVDAGLLLTAWIAGVVAWRLCRRGGR